MTTVGSRGPDCPRNDEAVAWALHALEPAEEQVVLAHLPGCASCRAQVRDTEAVMAGLADLVEPVPTPPALRDRILTRAARTPQATATERVDREPPGRLTSITPPAPVAAEPPAPPPTGPAPPAALRRRRSGAGRLAVAAAVLVAVLVAAGLGIRGYLDQQQRDAQAAQAAAITQVLTQLGQPGTEYAVLVDREDDTPVAAVVTTPDRRQVFTTGVPENDVEDTTYVLWGARTGERPQALGTFDVTGTDPSVRSFDVAQTDFDLYEITREPGRAAPPGPTATAVVGVGPVRT